MSDPRPPQDPAEHEVTRLLAGLGHEPLPDDVAQRLTGVLAELQREPDRAATAAPPPGPPRRRRWPQALLAAAAVVAGGYAVGGTLVGGTMSGQDDSGADTDTAAEAEVERTPDRSPGGGATASDAKPGTISRNKAGPVVRPERLRRDARAVLVRLQLAGPQDLSGAREGRCRPPSVLDAGTWLRVRYDGRPAALVAAPEVAGRVQVEVYACAGGLLAARSIPAP